MSAERSVSIFPDKQGVFNVIRIRAISLQILPLIFMVYFTNLSIPITIASVIATLEITRWIYGTIRLITTFIKSFLPTA
jgi:hypothetical protein